MRVHRHVVAFELGEQRFALAQVIAQDAVHQPLERPAHQRRRSRDGLVDNRVDGLRAGLDAVQRGQQQGFGFGMPERFAEQFRENEVALAVAAENAVGHVLRRGARGGGLAGQSPQRFAQAAPVTHRGDGARRQKQAPGQRVARQR